MYFERKAYLKELISAEGNGMIKIITGIRRCGKSFLLFNIFCILSPEGAPLGVGRISCDSATARRNLGRKGLKPLIHCDYLYLE